MNLKYCGAALDYSGYGEANRHDIAALLRAGVDVTTQIPKYCLEIADFGRLGELVSSRQDKNIHYRIKILHLTPNVFRQYMEVGKYHIGRVFWETDKLPEDFARNVELMDEIWTGSDFNAQAIRKAGVTKPIYIIPEAIDVYLPDIQPYEVATAGDYKFYSIFEWTERKNPAALLEAYFREFQDTEGVSLNIKTYVDNFTPEKGAEIELSARMVKRKLGLAKYPPVYFRRTLMDRHQVYRFHKTFDCFVSAHRGEGWGIPQMEALLLRKPVISTNLGGIHEYLKDKEHALLIPYTFVPVQNNRNEQWYAKDQNWGEVDIPALQKAMRWAFENRHEAEEMGQRGGELVEKTFSLDAVGARMTKRLYEIMQ